MASITELNNRVAELTQQLNSLIQNKKQTHEFDELTDVQLTGSENIRVTKLNDAQSEYKSFSLKIENLQSFIVNQVQQGAGTASTRFINIDFSPSAALSIDQQAVNAINALPTFTGDSQQYFHAFRNVGDSFEVFRFLSLKGAVKYGAQGIDLTIADILSFKGIKNSPESNAEYALGDILAGTLISDHINNGVNTYEAAQGDAYTLFKGNRAGVEFKYLYIKSDQLVIGGSNPDVTEGDFIDVTNQEALPPTGGTVLANQFQSNTVTFDNVAGNFYGTKDQPRTSGAIVVDETGIVLNGTIYLYTSAQSYSITGNTGAITPVSDMTLGALNLIGIKHIGGGEYLIKNVILTAATGGNQAPSAPSNPQVQSVGSRSAVISFDQSTDSDGTVDFYELMNAGVQIATSTASPISPQGLTPGTEYAGLTIRAVDNSNERSADSPPITFTTTPLRQVLEVTQNFMPTKADLAAKTDLTEAEIPTFQYAAPYYIYTVTRNYQFALGAFDVGPGIAGAYIKGFYDEAGLLTVLEDFSFRGNTLMTYLVAPELRTFGRAATVGTAIPYYYFEKLINLDQQSMINSQNEQYIPLANPLGATAGNDNVYANPGSNIKAFVHADLATNNAGAPDGDIATLLADPTNSVVYGGDRTPADPILDLTLTEITNESVRVVFSPANSTVGVDYYLIYADDGSYQSKADPALKTSTPDAVVSGLTNSTTYTIKVVAVTLNGARSAPSQGETFTTLSAPAFLTPTFLPLPGTVTESNGTYTSTSGAWATNSQDANLKLPANTSGWIEHEYPDLTQANSCLGFSEIQGDNITGSNVISCIMVGSGKAQIKLNGVATTVQTDYFPKGLGVKFRVERTVGETLKLRIRQNGVEDKVFDAGVVNDAELFVNIQFNQAAKLKNLKVSSTLIPV